MRVYKPVPPDETPRAFDDEHERAVLGCLLTYTAEALEHFGSSIDPALFFSPACKTMLAGVVALQDEGAPVNIITLTDKMREWDKLEAVGGPAEVTRLTTYYGCRATAAEWHLGQVRAAAALRASMALVDELSELVANRSTNPIDVLAKLREGAEKISSLQEDSDSRVTWLEDLKLPAPNDGNELLRHRFLCRRGGLLLTGPTGIGKSSLGMQAAVCWALGKPCFGILPARPLRSLIIQAENDDGDLAEMWEGVCAGLELSKPERERVQGMIALYQEDARCGEEFFMRTAEPRLRSIRPDLFWIDPALSYIGGDSKSQEDVGRFLRNQLNPLLHRYECGGIVTHHTNKPPSGKEKTEWSGSDLAYLGSGSAEWANWARAVIGIRGLGEHGVFELCLGKRGGRVGWKDKEGQTSYSRLIGHAKEAGRIYWREAENDERPVEKKGGRREVFSAENLLEILGKGSKSFSDLWTEAEAHNWSKPTFKRRLAEMVEDKLIVKSQLDGDYSRKTTP